MLRRLSLLAEDIAHLCHDYWRSHIVHAARTLHLVPLIFGLVALLLFAQNGQLREVYLRIIEASDWPKLLLGLVAMAGISSALFVSYMRLTHHRAAPLYGSLSNVAPDPWLTGARAMAALVCAALPFAGLLWGLWQVCEQAGGAAWWAACLASAALVLGSLWQNRWNRSIGRWSVRAAVLLLCMIFAAPLLPPAWLVSIAQGLGPLAVVALQFLAVLAVFAGLSRVRAWIPGVLVVALLAHQIYTSAGAQAPDDGAQFSDGLPPGKQASEPKVVKAFRQWLEQRRQETQATEGRYPVFIIAAQGGGIYAASATANLLAALQDDCPDFSRHVFAISGVSGGSVGAAIFSAMLDGARPSLGGGCGDPAHPASADHTVAVGDVLTKDHLSPVLALLVPEIAFAMLLDLVELVDDVLRLPAWLPAQGSQLPGANTTRASAIEASLACGDRATRGALWRCIAAGQPTPLRKPMAWRPSSGQPVLILNTTLSELGSIVAFAPFGLRDLGEPSLRAFSDPPFGIDPSESALVTAAVASARFPGVLPPYPLRQGGGQWNFVDGGYADASGVATAGAVYRALRTVAAPLHVDLRLILLVGDDDRGARHRPGSSAWADLRVPIEAILNVQAGIGSREIVRALNQFADDGDDQEHQHVFRLRFPATFLGWTISRTSNASIASAVKKATACPDAAQREARLRKFTPGSRQRALESVSMENACQLEQIRKLLAPSPA